MLPLGLSAARQRAFHQALKTEHTVMPTVQVMNLDRRRIADVSPRLIEGAVTVSNDADTTRGCSLNLYDPKGSIALDSGDPADGAMFLNNAVRVVLSYTWPGFDDWVDVPVFDGPVTSVNRDADTLAVECQGWESRARRAVWEPRTYAVNYIVALIRTLMRLAGETRFDMPDVHDIPRITTEALSLGRTSTPWGRAQKLARSLDRQLFYDGRGKLRLRKLSNRSVWTFRDGENGSMTSMPRVTFDVESVRNIVWVKGAVVKGKRVEDFAQLPGANPLSPKKLGRNGQPSYLLEVIENDHIKTTREAHEFAVQRLNRLAAQAINVEFDAMPVPHLDPGDTVDVQTSSLEMSFPCRNFTIPLAVGDSAAIGYTRHVVKGRKAHNRPIEPIVVGDLDLPLVPEVV